MSRGWVRLHRKILDNPLLRRDLNAYIVFTKLLLVVDKDTGKCDIGRFQLADLTGLKPTTAYNVVSRLRKAKMVTQASNNKYTIIGICNWSEYQSRDDIKLDNKMTTSRQQDDTKQELRIKKVPKGTKASRPTSLSASLVEYFEKAAGRKLNLQGKQKQAAQHLVGKSSEKYKRACELIDWYFKHEKDDFMKVIPDVVDLEDKWNWLDGKVNIEQPKVNFTPAVSDPGYEDYQRDYEAV